MTSRDFCYWLQGYFEVTNPIDEEFSITPEQCDVIKKHLQLVFVHEIDPSMGDQNHQTDLVIDDKAIRIEDL